MVLLIDCLPLELTVYTTLITLMIFVRIYGIEN